MVNHLIQIIWYYLCEVIIHQINGNVDKAINCNEGRNQQVSFPFYVIVKNSHNNIKLFEKAALILNLFMLVVW